MNGFPEELLEALSSPHQEAALEACNSLVETYFETIASSGSSGSSSRPSMETNQILSNLATQLSQVLLLAKSDGISIPIKDLVLYLRSTKNLLRWHLQNNNITVNHKNDSAEQVQSLQSTRLLTCYHSLLEYHADEEQVLRYATLCLLYSTWNNVNACSFLANESPYLRQVSNTLTNHRSTSSVLLATLRLLHSLLVHLQDRGFVPRVQEVVLTSMNPPLPPWITTETPTRLVDCLVLILQWSLPTATQQPVDRPNEIAIEVLRILYVLRHTALPATLLLQLLQSPSCRLPTLSLFLEDATPLLQQHDSVLSFLLETLDCQVRRVVHDTLVGPPAVSALLPIVGVLHQLVQASSDIRIATKEFVFPNHPPRQQPPTMRPSDAPPGTLRHDCIQLLQWTEAHVKRCMGELLWELLGDEEFVASVGWGNAIPILQAKGKMPPLSP